jgi:tetratricopeptide (TPR) repeat protein
VFSARFLRSISRIDRPEDARRFLRLDRYWCAEVAEPLLERIDELVLLKPKNALELAEIALELVQRIRDASRSLRAHAHCSLGVAQRFLGRLPEAEVSFRAAVRFAEKESVQVQAMVSRQRALLLFDRGQSEAALKLVAKAVASERREGLPPSKSLLCQAVILGLGGNHLAAADCCSQVLDLEDPASPVYISAMQNLAAAMAQRPLFGHEIVETRKLLRRVRDQIRGTRQTPVRYAVWHTEALLHMVMEEFRQAIDHLRSARRGYLQLNMLQSYANVSVDLADAYLKRQDEARVMPLISRTVLALAEAGADEKIIEPFRLAEKESSAQAAIKFLRPGRG